MFTLAGAGSHLIRKKSYSSVDFPSLWATGLGRSGIGPEAGGGGGRWAGGEVTEAVCGRHVRDAGESLLCPARQLSCSQLEIALPSSSFTPAGWTFQESKGELLHCWLAQNYFPSMLH